MEDKITYYLMFSSFILGLVMGFVMGGAISI